MSRRRAEVSRRRHRCRETLRWLRFPVRFTAALRFNGGVPLPLAPDELSPAKLKELVEQLLAEVAALKQTVAAQREEIARLKGLKGPPSIKPSGMERATASSPAKPVVAKPSRDKVRPRVSIEERIVPVTAPAGSRFKGYESFLVQDLVLSVRAVRYRRERWVTLDGQTILAPLPAGVDGHFGPDLRRLVLMLYHQGQTTLPRLIALGECQASCRMACVTTFVYAAPLFRVFDWFWSKAAWTTASRSGLSVTAAIGVQFRV
jgi:hypothetical protein